jgi:hypothetical protein
MHDGKIINVLSSAGFLDAGHLAPHQMSHGCREINEQPNI